MVLNPKKDLTKYNHTDQSVGFRIFKKYLEGSPKMASRSISNKALP